MKCVIATKKVNRLAVYFFVAVISGTLPGVLTPAYGQWEKHIIDDDIGTAVNVDVADMDGDTKLDLVVTDWGGGKLIWYQNDFPFWTKHIIDNVGVTFAWSGDMDGDDTLDVVASLYSAGKMVWYENNHPTWTQHMIDANTDGADFILVVDIDGDDTLDVVTAGFRGGDVVWYENNHPNWIEHIIEPGADVTTTLNFTDIDGDGLFDIAASNPIANKVVWYKNEGNGLSWTKYPIDDNLNAAFSPNSGDIDGDDTVDVVVTTGGPYYSGSDVVWYENNHPIWTKHVIDTDLRGATWPEVTDVDGDGTMDVIAGGFAANKVVWYENNHPTWTKHVIDANLSGPRVFAVSDVDGDGINDVIVPAAGSVVWYKNPNTTVAYGQSFEVYPKYIPPQQGDTLKLSAQISNPENHQVAVHALIQGKNSTFKDSLQLFDDGLHNDSLASDNIYGGIKWLDTLDEDYFDIKLRTTDSVESVTTYCTNVGHFTTVGSVEIAADSLAFWRYEPDPTYNPRIYLTLRNTGSIATATGITAHLSALDTCVTAVNNNWATFGDIPAGEAVMSSGPLSSGYYQVSFNQNCPIGTEVPFALSISSDGYEFWSDTLDIPITDLEVGIAQVDDALPTDYALHPAYPNPFNPVTTLRYDLPRRAEVALTIYDILGREVRTLVQGEQAPGYQSVVWDGTDGDGNPVASGVYLYRLEAGGFTQARKMVLLK